MAFKNQNVTPAKQSSTGGRVNMKANNVQDIATKFGTIHKNPTFQKNAKGGGTGGPKTLDNTPAKNAPTTSVPLGTTHHPVGEVPSYLKRKIMTGKQGSGSGTFKAK